jgi:hypothetical protein
LVEVEFEWIDARQLVPRVVVQSALVEGKSWSATAIIGADQWPRMDFIRRGLCSWLFAFRRWLALAPDASGVRLEDFDEGGDEHLPYSLRVTRPTNFLSCHGTNGIVYPVDCGRHWHCHPCCTKQFLPMLLVLGVWYESFGDRPT